MIKNHWSLGFLLSRDLDEYTNDLKSSTCDEGLYCISFYNKELLAAQTNADSSYLLDPNKGLK